LSKKNPFYSVLPETSLLQVVELFGSGTHRVAVVDADGIIKGILTQSRVVNYFYENVIKFPPIEQLFPKPLNELDIGTGFVVSAINDSFVLDALTMMNKNGLSSIAIVDSEGLLIGNISMTDIKDRYPVFDVRPTSTLGYTIAKLSATRAHRLWVVDERMRAVGVVSLTDILLVIARSAGANPKPKRISSFSSASTGKSE
ncbi:7569_t:CDS:2, partial [Cetraspora pellucida]